jgi:purine-nucleoside phosphorylase
MHSERVEKLMKFNGKSSTVRARQRERNRTELSRKKTDRTSELVERCARIISGRLRTVPSLGLVLGSGFQRVVSSMLPLWEMLYDELPGFECPGVPGHSGKLICAELGGVPVLVCSGRAHFYEGHEMDRVTFPVRVMAECGVKDLLLTNAAGGINPQFKTGDFMAFTDHINFTGENPLRGMREGFVDLSETYSVTLRGCFKRAAKKAKLPLREGVYIGVSGPSYETPAEIRAFRSWGADAVGMSTVPEAVMARFCKMRVAGLSCITNAAAGMTDLKLTHEEVLSHGEEKSREACKLLKAFALEYDKAGECRENDRNKAGEEEKILRSGNRQTWGVLRT